MRDTLDLPRLGLGTAPLGGLFEEVTERDALETIDAAYASGLRFFDTAPLYGYGLAEERLGSALGGRAHEYVLSTKVGRLLEPDDASAERSDAGPAFKTPNACHPVFDFSRSGIRQSVEASKHRLGTDELDMLLLHDPDDHLEQAMTEGFTALADMRRAGEVAAIGVGMNQAPALARFVAACDVDCVLIAGRYTLLDTSAALELLPLCVERGVGVILGGVFNSGILARPDASATFDYLPAPPAVLARAAALEHVCQRHGVPLMAAALQFSACHPAVTSVIVGARTAREIRQNVEMFELPLPAGLWRDLRREGLLPADLPTPDEI
jgi:D-threo-aldose 1-dehydrogenase